MRIRLDRHGPNALQLQGQVEPDPIPSCPALDCRKGQLVGRRARSGLHTLRRQGQVKPEPVLPQAVVLARSVERLLDREQGGRDERHDRFCGGLGALHADGVGRVFQQRNVEFDGDVIGGWDLVVPSAEENLLPCIVPLQLLCEEVAQGHDEATLQLPNVHCGVELRAEVHENINLFHPHLPRQHVHQDLADANAVGSVCVGVGAWVGVEPPGGNQVDFIVCRL
mmetsp:Transcript_60556/g.169129  ORF Transcript_60556/g.169129 Transcript_60556/m.169129 type:complete len:224 (+) Transcript_60556:173-844(+)